MWNQNNGNGQGYGQQQYGGYGQGEDTYDRLNRTKAVMERDPFIGQGDHDLMVISIVKFLHKQWGPSARATFKVLKSNVHPPGSRVVKLWNICRPSKFESQTNDADRFADFVRKVKGAPDTYQVGADCRALLEERASEQLARGTVIHAFGTNTSKNPQKPYVDVRFSSLPNAPDSVRANRAQLDAEMGASDLQALPPGQGPQNALPAPQQGYAMPPQGQYALPPGVQPAQMPVQQGMPQAGYGYAQPQPMQSPVPQQPTQPAQGGFLAQIPGGYNPQGNGGQGGQW